MGRRRGPLAPAPGVSRLLELGPSGSGLKDASLGVVAHPASVTPGLGYAPDLLRARGFNVRALFGPQHGARGEKQDNMIESRFYTDPATSLPVHSLYGRHRKPTAEMLQGLDALLFDLQDVGARVYTFIWTMALAMEAAAENGVRFVVLDRPNPIGGVDREGSVLRPEFASFVGLHPIPLRHGLTAGEVARWLRRACGIDCDLEVAACPGWRRETRWPETGLPWVAPSPNLPTYDSTAVYPGMVLLEGTNLSEGRGTTRPFELFGAPFLEPGAVEAELNGLRLPGVHFRGCFFEPTFQKHAGELCGGAQLHVLDASAFEAVRTGVEVLRVARMLGGGRFTWNPPPYEYEETLMPIDILWGSDRLRRRIDRGEGADAVLEGAEKELSAFSDQVESDLLYE